jgi:integrase
LNEVFSRGMVNENRLTSVANGDTGLDVLELFQQEDEKGMGTIRCRSKCPNCRKPFKYFRKLGYACPECKTMPKRFYIDLWHQRKRVRLFSDKKGMPLDSYERAQTLLSHIRYEVSNHTFNATQYIKSEVREYWATTLLDKFRDSKLDSLAPSYKKEYSRMTELCKGFFETKDVREIRKPDIRNFKSHLEKDFTFKPKTIKNILMFLKTFIRWLNEQEYIEKVIFLSKEELQGLDSSYKHQWLSSEEQAKLFQSVPNEHKPIIAFLMLQGCRPGEARALRCKDVNLRDSLITVSATFSDGVYREKRKGRGAKSYEIPIHPEMMEFVSDRVRNNLPEAYVFTHPNTGKHYSETTLKRVWDSIKERAGIIKSFRLYDATRHSFGSQLIDMGSSPYKVSKLMGHSSIKVTEKYYLHSDAKSLRTDLEKLSLNGHKNILPIQSSSESK